VVAWLADLRKRSPVPWTASTYSTHSWKEYSVDMFLTDKPSAEGYYDRDKMVSFFLAADASAEAVKCEWRALYTDFEVGKRVNEALGVKRVHFQWHHGPAPYVLHAHFDIMPTNLPPPAAIQGEVCEPDLSEGESVCYPDDMMTHSSSE
jgi:hypothetical protein